MKSYLIVLKFVLLLGLVIFLFSFAQHRNKVKNLKGISIEFVDENEPFITENTVNKLLIQNHDSVTGVVKESIVLKEMEERLLSNEMIRNAEVYVTVDGLLGAMIEQRSPIGRVISSGNYYIDYDGKVMPLSSVYSARVPLVSGAVEEYISDVTSLLRFIKHDTFARNNVVGIMIAPSGEITLELRKLDCVVRFGKANEIKRKFQNFKAFYQKTTADSTLSYYEEINLQFGNQVVATKKENHGT